MTEERRKRVLSAFLAADPDGSNHPTCRRSLFRSRARFEACCRCVAPKPQLSVDSSPLLLPFIAFIRYAVMQKPMIFGSPSPGSFASQHGFVVICFLPDPSLPLPNHAKKPAISYARDDRLSYRGTTLVDSNPRSLQTRTLKPPPSPNHKGFVRSRSHGGHPVARSSSAISSMP